MSENIKIAVSELHKLINIKNVIGEPIETDDKLIIPVMRMGVGFGAGENITNSEGGAVAAGAGVEPISVVVIPKKGNDTDGVRVFNLTKGSETSRAISELGVIISDLIKSYIGADKEEDDFDESEYIEPEFTTKVEVEEDE